MCQSHQEQVAQEAQSRMQLTFFDLRRSMLDRLLVRLDGLAFSPETFQRLASPNVTFRPVGRYPYCGFGVGERCFIVGSSGTQDGEGSVPEEDEVIGLRGGGRMVSGVPPPALKQNPHLERSEKRTACSSAAEYFSRAALKSPALKRALPSSLSASASGESGGTGGLGPAWP